MVINYSTVQREATNTHSKHMSVKYRHKKTNSPETQKTKRRAEWKENSDSSTTKVTNHTKSDALNQYIKTQIEIQMIKKVAWLKLKNDKQTIYYINKLADMSNGI